MIYQVLGILEQVESNYAAYAPDLPGCVAADDSRRETEQLMYEALQWHIEALLADADPVPEQPSTAAKLMTSTTTSTSIHQFPFLAIIERRANSYHAYVPKLPDCEATAPTLPEAEQKIYHAAQAIVTRLLSYGQPVPQDSSSASYMLVAVPSEERLAALAFFAQFASFCAFVVACLV